MAQPLSGLGVYIAPELDLLAPAKRQWFEALGNAIGRKFYSLSDIPADAPVVVGPTKGTLQLLAKRRASGVPAFYWDRGYYDRFPYDMRLAKHRIVVNETQKTFISEHNGPRTAIPPLAEMRGGKKILVLAHSETAERYHGLEGWTQDAVNRVVSVTHRPVEVRRKGAFIGLAEQLEDCHCVVTGISNAAIEAALLGVNVLCMPESAAWPVARNSFMDIESPKMGDRRRWIESLSWGQFTFEEMLTGRPFELTWETYQKR